MKTYKDKIAVVTGGGSGMGREIVRLLTSEGCHVAFCDLSEAGLAETKRLCENEAPKGTRILSFKCDVTDEVQYIAFRDAITKNFNTDHINLLFNIAGISGGGSFLNDDRKEWELVFNASWYGVYYGTRTFMPLLLKSKEGHIINMSSGCGVWACLGPTRPQTAYSSAKFAINGFTAALMVDLRLHAPHIKASVVMPGFIGTGLATNSRMLRGHAKFSDAELNEIRESLTAKGVISKDMTDEQLIEEILKGEAKFLKEAPMSAQEAASRILEEVRKGNWRIFIDDMAIIIDRLVRANPDTAYDESFLEKLKVEGVDVVLDPITFKVSL